MEALISTANTTIATLQATPTRGLTSAFSGMAASSPARNDPVRRTLFPVPAPNTAAAPRAYRPDAERLRMILASPVLIQVRNTAGLAAYALEMTNYNRKHGARAGKPSEERPYPLTPGTVAVGSGECHRCGLMGHISTACTASDNLVIPEIETRWHQIVQSIRYRVGCGTPAAAINVVADADETPDNNEDVFGSAEYDAHVIREYLHNQGKAGGPSA